MKSPFSRSVLICSLLSCVLPSTSALALDPHGPIPTNDEAKKDANEGGGKKDNTNGTSTKEEKTVTATKINSSSSNSVLTIYASNLEPAKGGDLFLLQKTKNTVLYCAKSDIQGENDLNAKIDYTTNKSNVELVARDSARYIAGAGSSIRLIYVEKGKSDCPQTPQLPDVLDSIVETPRDSLISIQLGITGAIRFRQGHITS